MQDDRWIHDSRPDVQVVVFKIRRAAGRGRARRGGIVCSEGGRQ